jgi:hypothetical protein
MRPAGVEPGGGEESIEGTWADAQMVAGCARGHRATPPLKEASSVIGVAACRPPEVCGPERAAGPSRYWDSQDRSGSASR